ncbi:hypothetical protein E6O75_ATG07582 [Venturia nashicola]|uniref:Uncharacterized protein n=1 Tax=Venturia nashicola TaxID=86259 RepID=A0A4Z1NZ68_9PEZI|nr:hypothetical protein E6O75_ATG07582 [Venturia nashicola]
MKSLMRLRPVLGDAMLLRPFASTCQSSPPCLARLDVTGSFHDRRYTTTAISKPTCKQSLRSRKVQLQPRILLNLKFLKLEIDTDQDLPDHDIEAAGVWSPSNPV